LSQSNIYFGDLTFRLEPQTPVSTIVCNRCLQSLSAIAEHSVRHSIFPHGHVALSDRHQNQRLFAHRHSISDRIGQYATQCQTDIAQQVAFASPVISFLWLLGATA
jgi:formamidopyrimidine-DNA glycosylase